MSLAMYACPYDSPQKLMSDDFDKNDKRIKKTSRPKTQKNQSEKVNDVLLSINEDTLSDFHYEPEKVGVETEDVNIEEMKQNQPKGLSNYHKNMLTPYDSKDPPAQQPYQYPQYNQPPYSQTPQYSQSGDVLLDKINYIIGLLENQKDEKTNTIIEDLIIYALLGCFIIFIIDKFVSVGKYVR